MAWNFGHRRSDDLDFFTRLPMHLDAAEQARLATALRQLESTATVDLSQEETLHAVVGDCNVSFFGRPGTWLSEPVPVSEGFGLATAEEIAAMKLIAVSTRSAKKDFFDLHALMSNGYDASRMFAALQRMHPTEVDIDVGRHIALALTDFSDAELDPEPIVLDQTTWDTVKRSAERLATELRRHLLSMK